MSHIDILAIGDMAVDVFIKIKEAEQECDIDGDCKICLDFGSKIPYEEAYTCYATGNSSNVAISASRLGLKSALITNIGNDLNGKNCLDIINKEGVNSNYISIDKNKPTNNHYILWYKKDRTILVKHEEYEYRWLNEEELNNISPSLIYLSSLGYNSENYINSIISYLENHKEIKLVFSPGTNQIRLGIDNLKNVYKRSDIFMCNFDEAQKITNNERELDPKKLLMAIFELGPKLVLITNGFEGAYSYDGKDMYFIKALSDNPVESTGAGDSFSGAFVSAIIYGKDINQALMWASANAKSVINEVGPHKGLLTKEQIEIEVNNIDKNYQPLKIN